MEFGESTHPPRLRGRGRNKCFWSDEESRALVEALQELTFDPTWRTDCGFKCGYTAELHKRILVKLPTFSKQADPHIDSKLKWLKSKFNAINEMCSQSGCSWNHAKTEVKCERQWYENWVKTHKDAMGLWGMKFPYLEALDAVYGKGRVTSQKAKGLEDAIQHLKTEETTAAINLINGEEDGENSETQASKTNSTSTLNSRKQKKLTSLGRNDDAKRMRESTMSLTIDSQLEAVSKKFGVLIDSLASIASTLANEDKREQLRENKANTVVQELTKLGLPDGDMFRAADILSANYPKLNVFSQLSLDQKRHYVVDMLYPSSFPASGSAH